MNNDVSLNVVPADGFNFVIGFRKLGSHFIIGATRQEGYDEKQSEDNFHLGYSDNWELGVHLIRINYAVTYSIPKGAPNGGFVI
jgi:hypothetical protein